MKKTDLWFSVFLLALSVFTFSEGMHYPFMHRRSPGSGFFPVWMSVLLFVLALANAIKIAASLRKGGDKPLFASASHRNRVIVFFMVLMLYIVGITHLGMLTATFLLAVFVYKVFDKFTWKSSLPTAVGIVVFVYLIFNVVLGLRLPTGFWN